MTGDAQTHLTQAHAMHTTTGSCLVTKARLHGDGGAAALALEEAGGRAGQAAHPHHHTALEQVRLELDAPAQPHATLD